MANNFLAKDGRIVEKVAQAQAESGQLGGAATATRKADVMKMFQEVQATQQQLNGNLIKDIENKITENTSI